MQSATLSSAFVVVCLVGCGPSDHGTAVNVALEERLGDGTTPERLEAVQAEPVMVVAEAERLFPIAGPALLDVELAAADGSHTHVVISDGVGDGHVALAAGAKGSVMNNAVNHFARRG
jgi:hypothetical protein